MQTLKPGKYRHYKGKEYKVIGVARHSETLEELVIYRALYDSPEFGKNALWARPKKMFLEDVTVDGKTTPRFKLIEPIKNIDDLKQWLHENTTIIDHFPDNEIDGNYTSYFNREHDWRFKNERHEQADLQALSEIWEKIWSSHDKWSKELQALRFLDDSFKLFYYSFSQLRDNKQRLIISSHSHSTEVERLNMLVGTNLYGIYHHGKKCVDLLKQIQPIEIGEDDKTFCSKFSKTRNKFIEHNHNPSEFPSFQFEPSIWSTINTNSLMDIDIHDTSNNNEKVLTVRIDYYKDYFELEKIIIKALNFYANNPEQKR